MTPTLLVIKGPGLIRLGVQSLRLGVAWQKLKNPERPPLGEALRLWTRPLNVSAWNNELALGPLVTGSRNIAMKRPT
jgi:hypothetical protein